MPKGKGKLRPWKVTVKFVTKAYSIFDAVVKAEAQASDGRGFAKADFVKAHPVRGKEGKSK